MSTASDRASATGATVPPEVACQCIGICDREQTGPTGCRHCRLRLPDPVYSPCPRLGFGCGPGCDCCTPEQQEAARV